jgi:hypothetical protein
MIRFILFFTFGILTSLVSVQAEIILHSPTPHTVLQRNQRNQGLIGVSGYYTLPYTQLDARLIALPAQGGKAGPWTPLEAPAGQGTFRGILEAPGGWYRLEIRGTLELGQTDTATVQPVGIGEVFLIAGHSNAMGLPKLGARDGSERVVSFSALNKYLSAENITVAPNAPMPVPSFGQLKAEKYIFPSGESAWNWGELGTLLSNRLGVPVLFTNAGWAAANSFNWREAAEGKNTQNMYVGKVWPNRQPYSNLINTLRYYHSWLGIRAVLWFHGENDASHLNISQSDYYTNIRRLIGLTQKDFGHSLPWIIALCSVSVNSPQPYLPVLNAQIQLAATPGLNAWRGPYTDTIQVPRPEHGHFENRTGGTQGLTQLAQAWDRTLTDAYFAQVPAFAPSVTISAGVVPGSAAPGQAFLLPFHVSGNLPDSTRFEAQLLDPAGNFVAVTGAGIRSPLRITLPVHLPEARYRLRVVAQNPTLTGSPTDFFRVDQGLSAPRYIRSLQIQKSETQVTVHALIAANAYISRLHIERSDDRTTFRPVSSFHTLPANASTSILYSFIDSQPSEQTAYYRLSMETRSGKTEYSQLIAVFRDGVPQVLMAFPNPATPYEPIFVRTDFPEVFTYRLYDSKGTLIPVDLTESEVVGLSALRPFSVLSPGMYLLQITRGNTLHTQRILIR